MSAFDEVVECTSPEATQTITIIDLSALRAAGQPTWDGSPLTVGELQYRLRLRLSQKEGGEPCTSKYVGIFAYLCDNRGKVICDRLDPVKHGVAAHGVRLRFKVTSFEPEAPENIMWQTECILAWKNIAETPCCGWGIPRCIPLDRVTTGDSFKVVFRATISQQPLDTMMHMATNTGPSRDRLAGDIGNLLEAAESSDVDLHVDDVLVPAHKLILSARSAVFKAMFQSGFQEAGDRAVVVIIDASLKSLKAFLHFVYKGELPGNEKNIKTQSVTAKQKATPKPKVENKAREKKKRVSVDSDGECDKQDVLSFDEQLELLGLADKYAVSDLVHTVCALLSSRLNVENVARTISFADRHHCQILKEVAIKFATKTPDTFSKVRRTDDFSKLDKDCLIALLDMFGGGQPCKKQRV